MHFKKLSGTIWAAVAIMAVAAMATAAGDKPIYSPDAPSIGPENAKVTIVEYSDFQCPYCARMAKNLDAWRMQYPDDIRLIWMDRPLAGAFSDGYPFHPYTMVAHEAAAEAQAQGKFWEMEKWIFEHQKDIFPKGRPTSEQDLIINTARVAKELMEGAKETGVDQPALQKAFAERSRQATVEKRLAMAKSLGINSTPTVFVNGRRIGSDPVQVKKAVETALGKKLKD